MPKSKSKRGSKSQKNPRVSGAKKSTSVHEGFPTSTSNNYGFTPRRSSKKSASVYEGFPTSTSNNYGFSPGRHSAKRKLNAAKPNNEYGWDPDVSIYNTPEGHSVAGKKKRKKRRSKQAKGKNKRSGSNCGM